MKTHLPQFLAEPVATYLGPKLSEWSLDDVSCYIWLRSVRDYSFELEYERYAQNSVWMPTVTRDSCLFDSFRTLCRNSLAWEEVPVEQRRTGFRDEQEGSE